MCRCTSAGMSMMGTLPERVRKNRNFDGNHTSRIVQALPSLGRVAPKATGGLIYRCMSKMNQIILSVTYHPFPRECEFFRITYRNIAMTTIRKSINLKKSLTKNQQKMIRKAQNKPIIYDYDSPELAEEDFTHFKPAKQKGKTPISY